jgi:hypothetical protein
MDQQTNFDKLEEILINAPADELPGLLEHARLVVRIRSMQPQKRKYERKARPEAEKETTA